LVGIIRPDRTNPGLRRRVTHSALLRGVPADSLPRHVSRPERPPMAARSTQTKVLVRSARRAVRKVRNHGGSANITLVKELGERLSVPDASLDYAGPEHLRTLREQYGPSDDLPLVDGRVPLIWWTDTPNYGGLLSPWLVGRVAQRPVIFA